MLGLPCWGVDKGQGSILSLEFGEPRLLIREPFVSSSESASIRARSARRLVKPVGAWYLFVCCNWRLSLLNAEIAHSEADDEAIWAAIRRVDGQKLIGVALDATRQTTTFSFDLGATLATSPYENSADEQWWLRGPDKLVLSYRADGRYSLENSSVKPADQVWRPLPDAKTIYRVGSP